MSMENAILELAASIKVMADSLRSATAMQAHSSVAKLNAGANAAVSAAVGRAESKTSSAKEEAETVEAKPVRGTSTDEAAVEAERQVELEQAVQKVEDQAKKPTPAADTATDQAGSTATQTSAAADALTTLDYAKDVRPVLLAAIKKAGKEVVAAMIGEFGVQKADALKPEQLPAVLARAQKLAA